MLPCGRLRTSGAGAPPNRYCKLKNSMAIFHLSIKTVSRARGRSAVAAAAYRAGTRLHDMRLGRTFDYRRKGGVLHSELVLPEAAPAWANSRESLWNQAEKSETRVNSTTAREFEIALPSELTPSQQKRLTLKLANELTERHLCGVDLAIHGPGKEGDNRNHHAHILTTTRRLTALGFGQKCRELDDQKSGEVMYWRERWAELVNEALEAAQQVARVDHRSLEAQGIEREPTTHAGPARTAFKRRPARRPHMIEETTKLTPGQERLAKQLATMKARLARTDLSKFDQPVVEIEKGETSEKISTFER